MREKGLHCQPRESGSALGSGQWLQQEGPTERGRTLQEGREFQKKVSWLFIMRKRCLHSRLPDSLGPAQPSLPLPSSATQSLHLFHLVYPAGSPAASSLPDSLSSPWCFPIALLLFQSPAVRAEQAWQPSPLPLLWFLPVFQDSSSDDDGCLPAASVSAQCTPRFCRPLSLHWNCCEGFRWEGTPALSLLENQA